MTKENPANEPAADSSASPPAAERGAAKPPLPIRKRRFGWIRKILLGLVALVVLLLIVIGLAPTLLSTGAGRSFVVGTVNKNLNGHLQIKDWSVGWTSGIRLDGLVLFDAANRQILQLPHFSTKLSLVAAMRGQIHLGDTVVDGLDFFAERYPDGSLNFAKLARASESKPNASASMKDTGTKSAPTKLPSVDGRFQMVNCRGTFQTDSTDPGAKQPKQDVLQFKSIEVDVKIPSINDPIADSIKITVDSGGGLAGTIIADGHFVLAKNGALIDFSQLGELDVEQKVTVSSIGLAAAAGLLPPSPTVKIDGGNVAVVVTVGRDKQGQLAITPTIQASDVVLSTNGVADPIGAVALHGSILVPSAGAGSVIDQITAVRFDNLSFVGLESSATLNGSVADFMHNRNLQNVTVDLTYNAARIWKAYFPFLAADQQAKLKDAQVVGKFTKRITVNGSYPADMDFNHAFTHLMGGGDIQLELFEGEGITLKNFVFPFTLANGKVAVAFADKPAGQNAAPPAELNDGKLSLAGTVIDLSGPHMTVMIPPGTKLLENVSLNKQLASTIGDYVNNPLMIDSDTGAGVLTMIINSCDHLALDDSLNDQSEANQGVLDFTMTVGRIQLGNPTISRVEDVLKSIGVNVSSKSLQGDLNPLHVHMARGVTSEEMSINLGEHKKSLRLEGNAVMKTRMINMTLDFPFALVGFKSLPVIGDAIKFPMSGPANNPKFDIKAAIKKNSGVDPEKLLNGLFKNKNDKTNTGADGDQPKKDNPIDDILGQLKKKKKPDPDQ